MLVDEAEITIKGGHGGAGKVSFVPSRNKRGGPDGGNGGKGGNVFIKVVNDITALSPYAGKKLWEAENGEMGGGNKKSGRDGTDLEMQMPLGAVLIDQISGQEITLDVEGEKVLVARGGLGGRGNFEFRSPQNTTPRYAQPGLNGEEKHLKVLLKLIADFGLIGLPNAGKSSLLNELTAANAKVANYPFTTLEPNLGVLNGKVIADIPGLIEGAAEGKGLGIKFLKHIEKVVLILHCISSESSDVLADYEVVRKEIAKFKSELLEKEEIILLTKTDLVGKEEMKEKVVGLKKLKSQVLPVSIHDFDSLEELKTLLNSKE